MHHTVAHCSVRPPRIRCGKESFSPLDELDRAFLELARTGRVGLPCELVTGEQDDVGVVVPVDEVRAALGHPAAEPQARVRVWREVVVRAQQRREPWGLVAAGLAVPVLRRVLARFPRASAVEAVEVEQEAMAAFVTAVHAADTEDEGLRRELVAAAGRAAHRHHYAACRRARLTAPRAHHDAPDSQPEMPVAASVERPGNEYQVLLRAVRAGVVTCREAQVIARSRLGTESLTTLAVEHGISRRHFYRYRAEAEARLATFLEGNSA
jgi:hypothetical protein